MSIIISNVSESKGVAYIRNGGRGLQHYRVSINSIPISEFEHYTETGLDECLQEAWRSLEGIDIDKKIDDHRRGLLAKAIVELRERCDFFL